MRLGNSPLRLRLRSPVRVDRRALVALAVAAARPVEDQVGRELDQPPASCRRGDGRRAVDVHRPLPLALDIRRMDHRVDAVDRTCQAIRISDVRVHPLGCTARLAPPPGRSNVPARRGRAANQLAPEVPAAAGDQQPRRATSRGARAGHSDRATGSRCRPSPHRGWPRRAPARLRPCNASSPRRSPAPVATGSRT